MSETKQKPHDVFQELLKEYADAFTFIKSEKVREQLSMILIASSVRALVKNLQQQRTTIAKHRARAEKVNPPHVVGYVQAFAHIIDKELYEQIVFQNEIVQLCNISLITSENEFVM